MLILWMGVCYSHKDYSRQHLWWVCINKPLYSINNGRNVYYLFTNHKIQFPYLSLVKLMVHVNHNKYMATLQCSYYHVPVTFMLMSIIVGASELTQECMASFRKLTPFPFYFTLLHWSQNAVIWLVRTKVILLKVIHFV